MTDHKLGEDESLCPSAQFWAAFLAILFIAPPLYFALLPPAAEKSTCAQNPVTKN